MLDSRALVGKAARVIELVNRRIQITVCLAQFGWHGIRIIKVGECGAGVLVHHAGIEHRLRQSLDLRALRRAGFGPREGVVNQPNRVAITALQATANLAHV